MRLTRIKNPMMRTRMNTSKEWGRETIQLALKATTKTILLTKTYSKMMILTPITIPTMITITIMQYIGIV